MAKQRAALRCKQAEASEDEGEHAAKKQAQPIDPWLLAPERAETAEKQAWESFLGAERYRRLARSLRQRHRQDRGLRLTVDDVQELLSALDDAANMAERFPYLEFVEDRYRHALKALNAPGKKNVNERARIAVNRILGLPDRRTSRGADYDPVRIVQAYYDLTTGRISRPAFDALGGIDWRRKTCADCGLNPAEGDDANARIRLPLTRWQAIRAIANHYGATERGIYDQLKRAGVKGLPSTWPKV